MVSRLEALEKEIGVMMQQLSLLANLQEAGDETAEEEGVELARRMQELETEMLVERMRHQI